MEYTSLITPVALIATCVFIGTILGGLYYYYKYKDIILDLEMELDDTIMALDRQKALLSDINYNINEGNIVKTESTKLDDTFKAQLQIKDDNLDRLNSLREQDKDIIEGLNKNLETAASQILILENRISKNKKIAIDREKELKAALTRIDNQLDTIAELETDNQDTAFKYKDTDTEIGQLNTAVLQRDRKIERLEKRVQEVESELEELKPSEGETGYYKRMKKIQ